MKHSSETIISIKGLSKTYASGFQALKNVSLDIYKGEIFALLGPNGAGKTTLISIVSGIVKPGPGSVSVAGFDILKDYRTTRQNIGLVPQELTTDMFQSPRQVVEFSRGLFGKPKNPSHVQKTLESLSLWDKKNDPIRTLSGGMKRRVMIAKALSHEPQILFLDEPTAGVDVSLRREMWDLVSELREGGVTVILTTHYLEEAEAMADRIGVINHGQLIVVEEKEILMRKLGKKQLTLKLTSPMTAIPTSLQKFNLTTAESGTSLTYTYDATSKNANVADFLQTLSASNIAFQDLQTKESSLEEIFITLVKDSKS